MSEHASPSTVDSGSGTDTGEKSAFTDLMVKLIAIAVFFLAFIIAGSGWDDAGVFGKGTRVLGCFFLLATAIGFFSYQGWAFLLVSIGALAAFFVTFIQYLLAWDTALAGKSDHRSQWLWSWIAVIALIGFIGRWKTERHFRPHLDVDHH